ncbi:MAG: VWA domain-containing protein [Planctomycetota bacterium]
MTSLFANPAWLLALLVVPWLAFRLLRRSRGEALPYSSTVSLADVPRTWRQRLQWLPAVLLLAAIALMVIGMARPREGRQRTQISSEGIAIELVVDRSGSMNAMDFIIEEQRVNRLVAIKNVASKFVLGQPRSDTDEIVSDVPGTTGRPTDLIGLLTFAGYADPVTPLTLDHEFLVAQLNELEIVQRRSEDGTAIGDAISLAAERLAAIADEGGKDIKSRIVILLTDGDNTAGEFDPMDAAELAKSLGIKVYTIGVGTKGEAPIIRRDLATGRQFLGAIRVNINERLLRSIAKTTGGEYYRATDTESLQSIYAEIDQLEKTKIESQSYMDFRELAVQGVRFAGWNLPPVVLSALACLILHVILRATLFRQLV